MRIFLVLIAPALLGACVPFPHFESYTPTISGVVTRGGAPVQGATVAVSAGYPDTVVSSATDAEGKFVVLPIRQFWMTMMLIGEKPLYRYSATLSVEGKRYAGYHWSTNDALPKHMALRCELDAPLPVIQKPVYCVSVGGDN